MVHQPAPSRQPLSLAALRQQLLYLSAEIRRTVAESDEFLTEEHELNPIFYSLDEMQDSLKKLESFMGFGPSIRLIQRCVR
jgi:hypothetical protein